MRLRRQELYFYLLSNKAAARAFGEATSPRDGKRRWAEAKPDESGTLRLRAAPWTALCTLL